MKGETMQGVSKVDRQHQECEILQRDDGSLLIVSSERLGDCPASYSQWLARWAVETPDAKFLGEKDVGGNWKTITYAEAYEAVQHLAQALIDRGLSADRPLAIMSGNDISHALLALAAMHVGIPYVPISASFSLLSVDFEKLRHTLDLTTPGMIFVSSGKRFEKAIAASLPNDIELVVAEDVTEVRQSTLLSELLATPITPAVEECARSVTKETIAKVLFTSGSSAMPKGVPSTHGALCAFLQAIEHVWPFLADRPPVIVDWLPWSHTFGGNFSFGIALKFGGSLYIDDGRPITQADILKTVRNITDIKPTCFFGVPKSFDMILGHLRSNREFRDAFFSRLDMIFYAAASLSEETFRTIDQLSRQVRSAPVFITSGLASTEAMVVLAAGWRAEEPGILGLPMPDVQIKLVPFGEKLEMRVKGPSVMTNYWRQPDLSSKAFDEDGWYRMGDAVRFRDIEDLGRGLIFDGRISEDFKLSTGTWVSVGPLRAAVMTKLSPVIRDICITGHNRNELGLLIFPDLVQCRAVYGFSETMSLAEVTESDELRSVVKACLDELAIKATGSSNRLVRAIISANPLADSEVTDKGTLSFNTVLDRRAAEIAELYRDDAPLRVIAIS